MTSKQLEIIPLSELAPPSPAYRVATLALPPAELEDVALTCGHLIWVADQDLKKVQMQLGHTGLEMTAKVQSYRGCTEGPDQREGD